MRDIPLIFPISLAVIVLMLIFTSAYAISANAVAGEPIYSSTISPSGMLIPADQSGASSSGASGYTWVEKTAFLVCPLH